MNISKLVQEEKKEGTRICHALRWPSKASTLWPRRCEWHRLGCRYRCVRRRRPFVDVACCRRCVVAIIVVVVVC
jgi:hypothetical protein